MFLPLEDLRRCFMSWIHEWRAIWVVDVWACCYKQQHFLFQD